MLFQDAERVAGGHEGSPRTVVVGSGAVGLYAASQLAARGHRVVAIEAGTAGLGRFGSESWASIGRPHTGIRLGRGRSLGGTTSLWGGQLVEFQPIDFEGRDWMAGSRWPVSYAEVAPYYPPTYAKLGIAERVQKDEDVWKGIACSQPELGPEFEVFFTRWMGTPNFAQLFARQIQSDERMAVLTGHTAVGFRGSAGRLTAVRVADEKGRSHWLEGDTFVLAAETLRTHDCCCIPRRIRDGTHRGARTKTWADISRIIWGGRSVRCNRLTSDNSSGCSATSHMGDTNSSQKSAWRTRC